MAKKKAKKGSTPKSKDAQILANQKKILKKLEILDKIKEEVDQELKEEYKIEAEESEELDELKNLENLEHQLEEELKVKPLTKITYRDFSKSVIGALFGILGHFSFF
jgi:hypothetical protein